MPGYDYLVSFSLPRAEVPVEDLGQWFETPELIGDPDEDTVTFTLALTTCVSAEAGAWLMDKFLAAAEANGLERGLIVEVCS